MEIKYTSIGIIHTPFKSLEGMPIQSERSIKAEGEIEVYPQYTDCLDDLEGFSHIYILYHFHKSFGWKAKVTPFLDHGLRGLFSTRSPRRPNPIGLSILEVLSISENIIRVKMVDILDGTPLLDIKPYVPQFENVEISRIGWLEGKVQNLSSTLSDDRFISQDES